MHALTSVNPYLPGGSKSLHHDWKHNDPSEQQHQTQMPQQASTFRYIIANIQIPLVPIVLSGTHPHTVRGIRKIVPHKQWRGTEFALAFLVGQFLLQRYEHVVETPTNDHVVIDGDQEGDNHAGNSHAAKIRMDLVPTRDGSSSQTLTNSKLQQKDGNPSNCEAYEVWDEECTCVTRRLCLLTVFMLRFEIPDSIRQSRGRDWPVSLAPKLTAKASVARLVERWSFATGPGWVLKRISFWHSNLPYFKTSNCTYQSFVFNVIFMDYALIRYTHEGSK